MAYVESAIMYNYLQSGVDHESNASSKQKLYLHLPY